MASEAPKGLQPLVPPASAADPAALHRHGLELITAANRLALAWLREASAQHTAFTRRVLADVTANARQLAAAEDAGDQAKLMLDALSRAQESGVQTAQAITGLMQRIQEDSVALVRSAVPKEADQGR
jgi:hypothetical protein